MEGLLKELTGFLQLYDQQTSEWLTGYRRRGGHISCKRGCHNCCSLAVNCTLPEALWLARHLPDTFINPLERYVEKLLQLMSDVTDMKGYLRVVRNRAGGCPFLAEDGSCGVYEWRPLSCRSLFSTDSPKYCAADFSALCSEEKESFVSRLDRDVVRFPTAYVDVTQQLAHKMEQMVLAHMLKATGVALSGNLPYLVWLEKRHDLMLRFTWGEGEALRYLAHEDLGHRFLVDIQKGNQKVHLIPRQES